MRGAIVEVLATIGAPVTIGALLDQMVDPRHRDYIAEFLFGFRNRSFREFESKVIAGLLSVFMREDRLSVRKVLIYSLLSSLVVCIAFAVYLNGLEGDVAMNLFGVAVVSSLMLGLMSAPFDYASLWITKRIFLEMRPEFPMTIPAILADIILSCIPYLFGLAAWVLFTRGGIEIFFIGQLFELAWVGIGVSIFNSILISIVQIVILVFASAVRLLMLLASLSGALAVRSQLLRMPFAFIALIFGFMLLLI